ncbi:TPA: type 1 fimbrial protein [Stenotrophomonas maltophilia]|nr:type 1 fimbrial protein [Stenotrophomonas maltophilia]
MNKLAIALSAALSLGAAASASASVGTINFVGQVAADTCSVDIGGGGATTSITLTPITAQALKADAEAGSQRFHVVLKAGTGSDAPKCDGDVTNLIVRKDGITGAGHIGNAHTATPEKPASNVVVQLYRKDGANETAVNLQTDTLRAVKVDDSFDYEFVARYLVPGGGDATGGSYTGTLMFDVVNQ